MAKRTKRQFPQLPSHSTIRKAALEHISSGAPYLASALSESVADALGVTVDQRALRFSKNDQLAFENYVDRVKQEFTGKGIHTGPNGRRHKGRNEMYYPTEHGLAIARRAPEMSADEIDNLFTSAKVQFQTPTADPILLESRVSEALSRMAGEGGGLLPPRGSVEVQQVPANTTRFVRDPEVCAWVLRRAKNVCEVCGDPAPFIKRSNNVPFLEIHHVRPLASGGPDTVDNAIAACPNCHRELHFGIRQEALRAEVIAKIAILVDHPIRLLGEPRSETE
jgi:hypothetical protein